MRRNDTIDNSEDIIDSRDVEGRIEELESIIKEAEEDGTSVDVFEEAAELATLRKLREEAEGYCDWEYGATLIRDSYFEQHAEELAGDIGAIDPNASWPLDCIDWEKAAHQLQVDYTAVEFGGVTYWVR